MAGARPPISPEEVRRVLVALRELSEGKRIVLIGGQAVAWWVEFLEARLGDQFAGSTPTASKDIDFEGDADAVVQAATRLRGQARLPSLDDHTPNSGVVEFVDSDGWRREIDFLVSPLGLEESDVRDSAVLAEIPDPEGGPDIPLWVMHPERCLESRVANVVVLGTTHQMAFDQLRASITCARAFSRFVLDGGDRRQVLDLNERIFGKCLRDLNFKELWVRHAIDPFDAVLVDDRLGAFAERRYPQMLAALEEQRARLRPP